MQETRVQSLGQEDPLEKGMATHSSILAWRILWTERPGGLLHRIAQSWTGLNHNTYNPLMVDFKMSLRLTVLFLHVAPSLSL